MKCFVPNCFSYNDQKQDGVSFHRFPVDKVLRRLWIEAICAKQLPSSHHRICSKHFKMSDKFPTGKLYHLKKDAIPVLFDDRNVEAEDSDDATGFLKDKHNDHTYADPAIFHFESSDENQLMLIENVANSIKKEFNQENSNSADNNETVSIKSENSIKIEEDIEHVDIDKFDLYNPPANEVHSDNVPSPSLENSVPVQVELYENPYADLYEKACNDDILSFGLYVASKLKAFNNPYLQATAKHHISRLIFNIELKEYQVINKSLPSAHEEFQRDLESLQ